MAEAAAAYSPPKEGQPAPLVRGFGWIMLAVLTAFLINNVLNVSFGFPGAGHALSEGGLAWAQVAIYIVGAALAALYVARSEHRSLRWDAKLISDFNAYLIRSCFWVVLLVGVVDSTIAFMRTENLLEYFVSDDMAKQLGIARYVGLNVHVPLVIAGFVIGIFTRTLGFTWLALLIVAAELGIVISRFVFSYEQALMGDLVRYWYAALFLFASAHTLLEEGHVRVDVFYAGFSTPKKGSVNAIGSLLLGMTTAWVIIWIGFSGKTSIINSPIANFEVSQTGSVGMYVKYQMATFLGVFAVTMLIQFISYFMEAVADRRGEPGRREVAPITH